MNRRDTVLALVVLGAVPFAANAQQPRKVPPIGFLHPGFLARSTVSMASLRDGLRDLGYIDGETIKIESRWAQGKPETLPGLATELVRLEVDVLVAIGPASVMAAKQATGTLPIVGVDLETDPVASGLATSLARPGKNITGLFLERD
jgi:putative ABC transport system substrate-binding protein